MKPVFQTCVDSGKGDCQRAQLASVFELDISQVPNFILYKDADWFSVYWYFLLALGYEYVGNAGPDRHNDPNRRNYKSIDGYFLAQVKSKTFDKKVHAVVMDEGGIVVHDPNPNQRYLGINVVESGDLVGVDIVEKKDMDKGDVRNERT